MIETTIKPAQTDCSNRVQTERTNTQSFRPQPFQNATSKNPCHDGCNVTEKQLQTSRGNTDTVTKANEVTEQSQSSGTEKVSGGNCPGSNIIANILQDLFQALEATRIGR